MSGVVREIMREIMMVGMGMFCFVFVIRLLVLWWNFVHRRARDWARLGRARFVVSKGGGVRDTWADGRERWVDE